MISYACMGIASSAKGPTEPDVEAAEQLVQLSGEDDGDGLLLRPCAGREGKPKEGIDGPEAPPPTGATPRKGLRHRRDEAQRLRRKRFRSIAYIYSITRPLKP